MRIISGSARGRRLFAPKTPKNSSLIRPTSDRAREALFSIIGQERLLQSTVLDLFAGTGALGIEALSRGAKYLFLVDQFSAAIKLIEQNVALCGFSAFATIIKRDLTKGLFFFRELLEGKNINVGQEYFDLVFIDPPYDQGRCEFILSELQKYALVNQESLIVYEDRSQQDLPLQVGKLILQDQRKYGDTGFWFYRQG